VFTHVSRHERQQYLGRFYGLAPNALVDIIAGDGSGEIALWTADPAEFEADIATAGFAIVGVTDQQWDAHTHRYYRLRRAA
jgi:hypothetical protein